MNGIVLQGGGAKGSYHIGVWQALRELGIEIHAVTGTSIGALNGVMIAQERFDDVYDLWYNIEPAQLFKIDSQLYKKFLELELNTEHFSGYFKYLRKVVSEGGMDVSPLKNLIEKMVDEESVRESKIDFGLVTVDLTNLEPLELFIKDVPKGKLHEYLMGSCHLPIFKMDKLDGKILLDGMFYDNQPVKLMMQKPEIDTLILVENRGIGIRHKVDLSGITVHRINPSGDTGKTLDLTKDQARRNLKMGYYDAMRIFKGYKGVRYYLNDFKEEDILKTLYHLDFDCVKRVSKVLGIEPIESRRQIFEIVIPELAKILKLSAETDYKDFFIAVIESVAEYFKIDRFKIYEFNELLEIIREALSQDERKVVFENRRLIDRLLKQGNIIIGNMKEELIVEVMTAVLMDVRDINGISEKYEEWLNEPMFDQAFRDELRQLSEEEKEDRFYKDLEFGTGGLRGVLGAGSNRMNKYVVMRVTQGYADYLNKRYEKPSVAIAYDSRHLSDVFAQTAARVLGGNGIKVYLFDRVSATPELSFAVRELGASGGIVVTASHNPKEYNGYKVYQHEGFQILPDEAEEIIKAVGHIRFEDIKQCEADDAKIEMLGETFIETYYKVITDLVEDHGEKQLKIVYTPLNGAGARPVVEVLKRTGFHRLETVKEQMVHDPNFTTVPYPNPEEVVVFDRAINLGEQMGADILMATDPDADRVGVVVRHKDQYLPLNGNQIGALLSEYLLSHRADQAIVTTIVSSHLCDRIARKYDASIYKTLTGFKFIGEMMTRFERTEDLFVLGFEESYGYLTSGHARDKDAVNAVLVIAEMAETCLKAGKTLIDSLEEIYQEHGCFKEELLNFKFEGSQGLGEMNELIEGFRRLDDFEIVGSQLREKIDYLIEDTGLPQSNVIKFIYEDESWFAIRPSGTEPKLKIYLSVNSDDMNKTEKRLESFKKSINDFIGIV